MGFPGGANGKEPSCQCKRYKRCRFNPWVRKSPWRRAWQPTPVFLPGDFIDRGAWRATEHRVTKSQTQLKWLSTYAGDKFKEHCFKKIIFPCRKNFYVVLYRSCAVYIILYGIPSITENLVGNFSSFFSVLIHDCILFDIPFPSFSPIITITALSIHNEILWHTL